MSLAMTILFWFSAVLLIYTFLVYPLLVYMVSRFCRLPARQENDHPFVSVLVPVFNEEAVLEEKIRNCLELDYPADRIEIAFASDGSTDRTGDILRGVEDPRVTFYEYEDNRGKAIVLNETIPKLKGTLVLLSDASGMLNREAVRRMAVLFGDPVVGCVGGIYHIFKEGRSRMDTAESSYHGFEMMLRMWEGRYRTTLSGTGALCMIRRDEFESLPEDVINEDYILPARLALRGKRVVYESGAHIYDRISTSLRSVFRRRVRIAFGNWQQLSYLKALLNPLRGWLFLVFLSHKLLRMAFPFLLVLMFVSSYFLSSCLFGILSAGIGLGLVLSLLALALDRYFRGHNPLGFIALVFFNCLAVFWGTARFLSGRRVKW